MRLIGELKEEKDAFTLQSYLKKEHINSCYDYAASRQLYLLWVMEENDFDEAIKIYLQWEKNPQDSRFTIKEPKIILKNPKAFQTQFKIDFNIKNPRYSFSITSLFTTICFFIYLINSFQFYQTPKTPIPLFSQPQITPIEKFLLFDYPLQSREWDKIMEEYPVTSFEEFKKLPPDVQKLFQQTQNTPYWAGIFPMVLKRDFHSYEKLPKKTLFHSIRNGEIWRLISPVFVHNGFIHLLFNLSWLLSLGKPIEDRLGKGRFILLSFIIGITANVAQYLISGPFFIGYSGIIVGMVGFIWSRKKVAFQENYPLHSSVIQLVVIIILATLGIGLFSTIFPIPPFSVLLGNIANTAHIVGGLTGAAIGRLPCFKQTKL
jgi:GlpG protein